MASKQCKCGTPLKTAEGIGPYCPSKDCPTLDDQEDQGKDDVLFTTKVVNNNGGSK